MDQIDVDILEVLQTSGRMSMVDLGKKVNMSQPAVKERVRKLEEKGVIQHYQASISAKNIGKGVTTFILFQTNDCSKFVTFCEQSPEVIDLYRISGQFNYLMKVVTTSMESLESFSNQCNQYGSSMTLIVLTTRFEQKPIFPDILSEV